MNIKLFAVTFTGKKKRMTTFEVPMLKRGTLSMRALYCIRVCVGRKEKEKKEGGKERELIKVTQN